MFHFIVHFGYVYLYLSNIMRGVERKMSTKKKKNHEECDAYQKMKYTGRKIKIGKTNI